MPQSLPKFVLLAFWLTAGCALTTDHITLEYPTAIKTVAPPPAAARLPGAEKVTVQVTAHDARANPAKVSAKKNGYGMEMAPIVSDTIPADLLATSIRNELIARGFTIGDASVIVQADIQKFWNDFKLGFFAGDADAELIMNVTVKRPDGSIAFSKVIVGNGREPNVQIAGGHNAKAALERAFQDGMVTLMNDQDYLAAIFQAGGMSVQ